MISNMIIRPLARAMTLSAITIISSVITIPCFASATTRQQSTAATTIEKQIKADAAAKEQEFKNSGAVTLLDSTFVSVKPSGSGTFNITRRIKIQTIAGGLKHHCIVYDYDPLTAFARIKYARIEHPNGTITNIDTAAVKDYVAPARLIFWGASQIMLEVGQLNKGDVLAYEIEKKGFTYALLKSDFTAPEVADDAVLAENDPFAPPMHGQFYDIVPFWVDQPTRRKVYCLSLPATKNLQYKLYQYDGPCETTQHSTGNTQTLKIALNDQVPFKREPSMVNLFDVAPKLMLSTTKDWPAKSRWFYQVNEDFGAFNTTPEAKALVKEILKGKKTEMEKISALTHWVADNIRYVGLTMGKGEGFTLHTLDMNLTDRGGVCKDIAGTLIGMLRTAGFEAYPAMTMAGSRVEQIPADHFNHCVCVVKLKNGTLLPLDPTWVPFCRELWSSAEQQQNYLPGIPGGSDLKETPLSPAEDHYLRIFATDTLTTDGTLRGTFTLTAEGQSDAGVRGVFTRGWMTQWGQSLEEELLKVSPEAKLLSVDYGKDPKDYQAAPIKLIFKYEIPHYAVGGAQGMLLKPLVTNNLYRGIQSFLRVGGNEEERQYAFSDRCSRLVQLEESILVPEGMTMQTEQLTSDLQSEAASIKGSIAQSGNTIKLSLNAQFNKRVYNASDWKGFKAARDSYTKFQDYIYLK